MLSAVILDRQDDKVLRSVVVLDVVPVVDVLIGPQSSAQHCLHDVTVLKNVLAVHPDGDVAVAADEPSAAPVGVLLSRSAPGRVAARTGAEPVLTPGDPAWVGAELCAAPLASCLHSVSSRSRWEPISPRISA